MSKNSISGYAIAAASNIFSAGEKEDPGSNQRIWILDFPV
jgi:hypothetical protein